MKRWQLPVYFQLRSVPGVSVGRMDANYWYRFREIVNIVEDVLSNSKLTIPTDKIEQRKEEGALRTYMMSIIVANCNNIWSRSCLACFQSSYQSCRAVLVGSCIFIWIVAPILEAHSSGKKVCGISGI